MEAWERPDGQIHIHDPSSGKLLLTYLDDDMDE